jgi:hypothetical protein
MLTQKLNRFEHETAEHVSHNRKLPTLASDTGYPLEPWPGPSAGRRSVEPQTAANDLRRRVENFLACQSVPALRRLSVAAEGATVLVRGVVRTYYEKQLAIHCSRRVAGVMQVIDAVEVDMDC